METGKLYKLNVSGLVDKNLYEEIRDVYAIVQGKKGFIVTDNEFCFQIRTNDERASFDVYEKFNEYTNEDGKKCKTIAMVPRFRLYGDLSDLVSRVVEGEEIDISSWIKYFGIKGRICNNYEYFKKACKEIEADLSFPEWKSK
jgi:hypothetical protein